MNTPAPGWYPDPAGGGGQRYWDGERWTTDVRPAPAPAPPPVPPPTPAAPTPQPPPVPAAATPAESGDGGPGWLDSLKAFDRARLIGLGGAVVAVLGLLFPWFSAGGQSENGFYTDLPWILTGADLGSDGTFAHGPIYLVLAGVALVALLGMLQPARTIAVASSAAIAVLCVANFWNYRSIISDLEDQGFGSASVGFGMYVTFLGGAAALYGALRGDLSQRLGSGGGSAPEAGEPARPVPPAPAQPSAAPPAPPTPPPTQETAPPAPPSDADEWWK